MTTFEDRQKAFESQYAHDQEVEFRVNARRMKLVGLWAAAKFGKEGATAEAYAKEVVMSDFEAAGIEDVVGKLATDFHAAGITVSEKEIRLQIDDLYETARAQIYAEPKPVS